MAILIAQQVSDPSVAVTYAAASAAGDETIPGDNVYLLVKNGAAVTRTVTLLATRRCSLGALHNIVEAIPAGEERWIGPLSPSRYSTVDNTANWTYDAEVSVTVAVVRV